MVNTVKEYIRKYHMLAENDIVIAGVSGGADSMCLLLVLEELKEQMGFDLSVVHVNHMLRGEAADADEEYVEGFCQARGIPFEAFHIDVAQLADERKLSTEEAGRAARREAFAKAARRCTPEAGGRVRIALAHHQEDNAETFLLNLARGSRLRGLGGISPVNGEWIHPLLCVGRGKIEKFLEEKRVSYCMDATNLEDTYTRNRIRRKILPVLTEQVNSRAVEHINSAAAQLREIRRYLDAQTEEAYRHCCIKKEEAVTQKYKEASEDSDALKRSHTEGKMCLILLKESFDKLDGLIRSMVGYRVLEEMAGQAKDLEECHVDALCALMEKQVGRRLILPYGIRALRTYGGIEIRREENGQRMPKRLDETAGLPEVKVQIKPGETKEYILKNRTIVLKAFLRPEEALDIPKKTYTKWFDYDIIEQGLSIRTRRAGDEIVFDGMGNTQKLKKMLINEKIPSQLRDEILLVADGNRILWAAGVRQSKAYQVTEHTKNILEITVR